MKRSAGRASGTLLVAALPFNITVTDDSLHAFRLVHRSEHRVDCVRILKGPAGVLFAIHPEASKLLAGQWLYIPLGPFENLLVVGNRYARIGRRQEILSGGQRRHSTDSRY